jgi:dipeptidyl aminopeptidase/acylaminoacyl peptidase
VLLIHGGPGAAFGEMLNIDAQALCAAGFGVAGLSYGGYLTCWLACTTNRFRAAVAENPVTDLVSMFGTSDVGRHLLPRSLDADQLDDVGRTCVGRRSFRAGSMLGAPSIRLAQDEALVQWMEQWLRHVEDEREWGEQ